MYSPLEDIYQQSIEQQHELGDRLVLDDGRVFRYAKSGEALVAGRIQQSPVAGGNTTEQIDMTVAVASVANFKNVTLTAVTDAITANQFKDGYLVVYSGTATQGGGQTYKIESNGAASAGGNFSVITYQPHKIAISTSAKVSVCKNPYDGVIIYPTTSTGMPVGVPLIAVTSSYYCWLQTWGICGVWNDAGGGLTVAADVLVSNQTAGGVESDDAAKAQQRIGYPVYAGAGSKCSPIFLQIAP